MCIHEDGTVFIRIVWHLWGCYSICWDSMVFIRMIQCLLGWYVFVRMVQDLMEMQPDGQSLASSGNISTSTNTITDCNISLQFKMVSACSEKPTCASPCLSAVCFWSSWQRPFLMVVRGFPFLCALLLNSLPEHLWFLITPEPFKCPGLL